VISSNGTAVCVFPNTRDTDNLVQAGSVTLPRSSAYSFPVTPPFGRDLHLAVLSDAPLAIDAVRSYRGADIAEMIRGNDRLTPRGVAVKTHTRWSAAGIIVASQP